MLMAGFNLVNATDTRGCGTTYAKYMVPVRRVRHQSPTEALIALLGGTYHRGRGRLIA